MAYRSATTLKRHGIEHILIVNGHAGNGGGWASRMDHFARSWGCDVQFCSYWQAYCSGTGRRSAGIGGLPGACSQVRNIVRF